jgi:hypothetical protein
MMGYQLMDDEFTGEIVIPLGSPTHGRGIFRRKSYFSGINLLLTRNLPEIC